MSMRAGSHRKGFTLVEMVFYILFFAMFSILAVKGVLTMTRVFGELRVTRNLNQTAVTIMDRITRQVRLAYAVDQGQSMFGVNPGKLVMTKKVSGDDTMVEFFVENNRVKMKEGGTDMGYLGTEDIAVDILTFDLISSASSTSQAIKTRLQLSGVYAGSGTTTKTFYSTTVLRAGY